MDEQITSIEALPVLRSGRYTLWTVAFLTFCICLPYSSIRIVALAICVVVLLYASRPTSWFVPVPVLALVALCLLSLPGSVDLTRSIGQLLTLILTLTAAFLAHSALAPILLSRAVNVGLLCQVGVGLVVSKFGFSYGGYSAFYGLLANPNLMAFVIVIAATGLLTWNLAVWRIYNVFLRCLILVVLGWLLIETRSDAGLTYALVGLVFLIVVVILKKTGITGVGIIVGVVIPISIVSIGAIYRVLGSISGLNSNETLSGRTAIWSAAWSAIVDKPIFGWGLGSTTSALAEFSNAEVQSVRDALALRSFLAHNGYLDTAVQVGLPGLGVVALILGLGLVKSSLAVFKGREGGLWFNLLAFMITIYNFTEVRLLDPPIALFLLFLLAFFRYDKSLAAPNFRSCKLGF